MKMSFSFSRIQPLWLRFSIFALVGSPLFGITSLSSTLHLNRIYIELGEWIAYAFFVWAFIGLSVGFERAMRWISASTVLGLTVALSGGTIRKTGFWELVENSINIIVGSKGGISVKIEDHDLVLRLVIIMITIPYSLFILHSIPASSLIYKVSRPAKNGNTVFWLYIAIFVRVFQHVFEIAEGMIVAWKEENPHGFIPRHKAVDGQCVVPPDFKRWIVGSLWAWSISLLQQGLVFVPIAVRSWGSIIDSRNPTANQEKGDDNEHSL